MFQFVSVFILIDAQISPFLIMGAFSNWLLGYSDPNLTVFDGFFWHVKMFQTHTEMIQAIL